MTKAWMSFYVYVGEHQNYFLAKTVTPLLQELSARRIASRFFFLRYWDGGPHLRLRFETENNKSIDLKNEVKDRLSDAIDQLPSPLINETVNSNYEMLAQRFSKLEGMDSKKIQPLRKILSLEVCPYLPEFNKYGGIVGINIAHELWNRSSHLALKLFGTNEFNGKKKLGIAFIMLLCVVHTFRFDFKRVINWFHRYSCFWRHYCCSNTIEHISNNLERQIEQVISTARACWFDHNKLDPLTLEWVSALQAAQDSVQCYSNSLLPELSHLSRNIHDIVDYLLMQYAHTHNNRLGLTPSDEYYLASLALKITPRLEELA